MGFFVMLVSKAFSPNEDQNKRSDGAKIRIDREFALASASLRQSLQDMLELTEISRHKRDEAGAEPRTKSSTRTAGRCLPTVPRSG
jgi:hypothetical protein